MNSMSDFERPSDLNLALWTAVAVDSNLQDSWSICFANRTPPKGQLTFPMFAVQPVGNLFVGKSERDSNLRIRLQFICSDLIVRG